MPNIPHLHIDKSERQIKAEQHQAKLAALADKAKQSKLTLDDIYEQNQIIIEMLAELKG